MLTLQSFGWSPYQVTKCDTDKSAFLASWNKTETVFVKCCYITREILHLGSKQTNFTYNKEITCKELRWAAFCESSECRRRRWRWVTGGRTWKPCRAWRGARRCSMQAPPSERDLITSLTVDLMYPHLYTGVYWEQKRQIHAAALWYSVHFCFLYQPCIVSVMFHCCGNKNRMESDSLWPPQTQAFTPFQHQV